MPLIAHLNGTLAATGGDWVVLDVGGIGYKAFVPLSVNGNLPHLGGELKLYTYLHVREDALVLFGFSRQEEEDFFERLLDVNGVGPKMALTLLSAFTLEHLKQAIVSEDIAQLTRVPGVGKKTVQRIIIDLKDRLCKEAGAVEEAAVSRVGTLEGASMPVEDVVQTLMALGYSPQEARRALLSIKAIPGDNMPVEEMVKKALRILAKF